MSSIIQKGDKRLRLVSKSLKKGDYGSPFLRDLLDTMRVALEAESDGVAIAAPQVGVNVRLFLLSPKALPEDSSDTNLVYANPKIIKFSSGKVTLEEGCLSVRNIYGKVSRYSKVTVEAFDQAGKKFTRGATGLLAEIFQHEIDHLDGKLFIDIAKDLIEIPPNER